MQDIEHTTSIQQSPGNHPQTPWQGWQGGPTQPRGFTVTSENSHGSWIPTNHAYFLGCRQPTGPRTLLRTEEEHCWRTPANAGNALPNLNGDTCMGTPTLTCPSLSTFPHCGGLKPCNHKTTGGCGWITKIRQIFPELAGTAARTPHASGGHNHECDVTDGGGPLKALNHIFLDSQFSIKIAGNRPQGDSHTHHAWHSQRALSCKSTMKHSDSSWKVTYNFEPCTYRIIGNPSPALLVHRHSKRTLLTFQVSVWKLKERPYSWSN